MIDSIGNLHKYLGGHRGRLYQQGHVIKTWRPRFFVLERKKIKYYTDETLFRVNGEFAVNDDTIIYDVPGESEGRKFLFCVSMKGGATPDEVLLLSAQSQRDKVEWMEAISDAIHNGFKLVNQPELWLDAFYPSVDLGISYDNNSILVEYGNMLKPSMTEFPPSLTLRLADEKSIYSLVLIDLDSIHASSENKTVYLHWAIINIVGSNVNSGIEVAPYQCPSPEYDSGLHRFFFLLFNQNFVLTSGQADDMRDSFQHRDQFSYLDWVRTRNLGDIVGMNGFFAGWEEYCNELHQKRGYVPPQEYLLHRQDAYLQKEAESIWVEDAKMRLFQDLTLSDLFPPSVDIGIPADVGSLALSVSYNGEVVTGGGQITPEVAKSAPSVTFTPHQAEICGFTAGTNTIAVDFGLYTLLMVDLDLTTERSPKPQEEVHWVVINIPQSDIKEGVVIIPYTSPAPTMGTGLHRYVFCLYKQKKAFTPQQVDATRAFFAKRSGIKSYDWIRSHGAVLLNVPVGMEAFLAEWDDTAQKAEFAKHKIPKERKIVIPAYPEAEITNTLSPTSTVSSSQTFRDNNAGGSAESVSSVRTSFGSVLLDDGHGFFETLPAPAPFTSKKNTALPPVTPAVAVDIANLVHAGIGEEDNSRVLERKASQNLELTDIPDTDSMSHSAEFSPKVPKPSLPPKAPEGITFPESRDKRPDKKSEDSAARDAAALKEERRRADARKLEERRRISQLQEDEADLQEEKRKKALAEAEKLRKQEEMRRAMQEHEQAEAERVKKYEARIQAERQRTMLEQAEELRRLEQRQQEEMRRVIQRQQREEAIEMERQQLMEARLMEDKRRQQEQRVFEEASLHRLNEAQRLEERRRPKQSLRSKSEEDDYRRQQDSMRREFPDERENQFFRQREDNDMRRSSMSPARTMSVDSESRASYRYTPRSSFSSDAYDMPAPPASLNRYPSYTSSDVSLDPSAMSADYESESLSSSKQPRSVSFEEDVGDRRSAKERQRREQEILQRQRQAEEEYQIQRAQQLREEEAQRRMRTEASPPSLKRAQSFKQDQQRLEDERLARELHEEELRRHAAESSPPLRQPSKRDLQLMEEERVRREMEEEHQRRQLQQMRPEPALKRQPSFKGAEQQMIEEERLRREFEEQARRSQQRSEPSLKRQPSFKAAEQQLIDDERIARELHEQELRGQRSPENKEPSLKRQQSFKRDQYAEDERMRREREEEQRLRGAHEEEMRRREFEEEQKRRQQREEPSLKRQPSFKQDRQQHVDDERITRGARQSDSRDSPKMQPPNFKRDQQHQQQQMEEERLRREREERDRVVAARWEQEERQREEQARKLREQQEREQQERWEQEEREEQEREEARRIAEELEYEEEMRLLHKQMEEESLDGTVYAYDEKDEFFAPGVSPGAIVHSAQASPLREENEVRGRTREVSPVRGESDRGRDRQRGSSPMREESRGRQREREVSPVRGDRDRDNRQREVSPVRGDRDRGPAAQPSPSTLVRPPELNTSRPSSERSRSSRDDRELKSDQPPSAASPMPPPRSPEFAAARKDSEANMNAATSPRLNSQQQKQQRLVEEGLASARSTADLCVTFGVLSKGIFEGDKLRKKFSADYMFKESNVWIDVHRRSIHWGKVSLDVMNSKFLLLDAAASSPAALPEHLQPAGEFKGTCREVEQVDAFTFRLILTTGKLFEAKVSDGDKTTDWMKVLNISLQRRSATSN